MRAFLMQGTQKNVSLIPLLFLLMSLLYKS